MVVNANNFSRAAGLSRLVLSAAIFQDKLLGRTLRSCVPFPRGHAANNNTQHYRIIYKMSHFKLDDVRVNILYIKLRRSQRCNAMERLVHSIKVDLQTLIK